jgi:hypothetical protein
MNRDAIAKDSGESDAWVARIASACFVEELDLDSLPLSQDVKERVLSVLEELECLPPLEALSRCLSDPELRSSSAP